MQVLRVLVFGLVLSSVVAVVAEESSYFDLDLHALALQTVSDTEVIAQKRLEQANEVPISMAIVSKGDLQQGQVQNLHDLSWYVPNLTISHYNFSTPQIYIRGIGSNLSGAGDDPSSSLMIDGLEVLRPGFYDQPLFDLNRVEVIRGPLGTLYGNSAIGGMVHVVPQAPEKKLQRWLTLGVSERDGRQLEVINNQEAWSNGWQRTSFYYQQTDGHILNQATGNELGDQKRMAVRHQMDWGDTQIHVYFNKEDQLGPALQYGGSTTGGLEVLFLNANDDNNTWNSLDGFEERQYVFLLLSNQGTFNQWDYWHKMSLQWGEYQFKHDTLPASFTLFSNEADESAESITYEWRMEKMINDHRIRGELLLGYKSIDRLEIFDTRGLVTLLGLGGAITEDAPAIDEFDTENQITSLALVMEDAWQLDEHWNLILGIRFDYVEKDFHLTFEGGEPNNLFTNVEDYSIANHADWTDPSYRVVLDHRPTEHHLVYVGGSTGFKSGSLNSLPLQKSDALSSSKSETAMNYELGYKFSMPDYDVQTALSVFYNDYQDLQIVSGFDSTLNAAEAISKGAELQVEWKPLNTWKLNLGYHYLDASFRSWLKPSGEDFSGNHLARAPEESINLISHWVHSFSNYHLSWNLIASHESGMYFDDGNIESIRASNKTRINSAVTLYSAQSDWEVSIWGKNLLDETYRVFGQLLSAQFNSDSDVHIQAPGRTIGLEFVVFL